MNHQARRQQRVSFVAVACAAVLLSPLPASASPSQRLVKSPPHKLQSIEPPPGWELSPSPPSSRLIATWSHREGARLTLAAEAVPNTLDAAQLFQRSRASLERQGWSIGPVTRTPGKNGVQRVVVDATLDKGKRSARQLYVVEDGFAYVLTLVSATEQTLARQREFDETVASMRIGTDDN